MNSMSKILIALGLGLIVLGVLFQLGGKHFPLGRLPGDMVIERPGFKFYFPIATSVILSVVISLLLWLGRRFLK
jgi:hypothetical protein